MAGPRKPQHALAHLNKPACFPRRCAAHMPPKDFYPDWKRFGGIDIEASSRVVVDWERYSILLVLSL
jgi:hypothetical protein